VKLSSVGRRIILNLSEGISLWISLSNDRDLWKACVNTTVNIWVPYRRGVVVS
jgi:hypothetical protein